MKKSHAALGIFSWTWRRDAAITACRGTRQPRRGRKREGPPCGSCFSFQLSKFQLYLGGSCFSFQLSKFAFGYASLDFVMIFQAR